MLSRYGWIGAFIVVATPIPDDIVYIPLGLARYSPIRFAFALFTGKFVLSEAIVAVSIYFGRPFIEYLLAETSDPAGLIAIAALTIATTIVTIYYFIKIDWEKIIINWFPRILDEEDKEDKGRKNEPK